MDFNKFNSPMENTNCSNMQSNYGRDCQQNDGIHKCCKCTPCCDKTPICVTNPEGPVGPAGPQGVRGETGPQGPQGIQGEVGSEGPQGVQGEVGPQGPQGVGGETGPQGPQGLQGEVGPQGPQGIQGEVGPQGLQGEVGSEGPQGVGGETGPQGLQGIQGEIGPQGPQGIQGEVGPQGLQGIQGEVGPQGLQGIQGEVGPAGPAAAIVSATFFSLSTALNVPGAAIPLIDGAVISGPGITLVGATDIQLASTGFYLISYYFQGNPEGGDEILGARLDIAGVPLIGSIVESATGELQGPTVSNTILVNITSPLSTVRLINASSVSVSHEVTLDDVTIASVTVTRISD